MPREHGSGAFAHGRWHIHGTSAAVPGRSASSGAGPIEPLASRTVRTSSGQYGQKAFGALRPRVRIPPSRPGQRPFPVSTGGLRPHTDHRRCGLCRSPTVEIGRRGLDLDPHEVVVDGGWDGPARSGSSGSSRRWATQTRDFLAGLDDRPPVEAALRSGSIGVERVLKGTDSVHRLPELTDGSPGGSCCWG